MRNPTHDPGLRSWVESANDGETDFPLQNLPYGVFRPSADQAPRVGVAIGDRALDLAAAADLGLLPAAPARVSTVARSASLNALMALGRAAHAALRRSLSALLRHDTVDDARARQQAAAVLYPIAQIELLLPVEVGDYTDFYASIHHATNVGTMLRPENPLLPNYKWIPIGYHGRASSLVVSGTPIRRPYGQTMEHGPSPSFAPSARMDYEAELGFYAGEGNTLGERVGIEDAADHIFGVCLLNDWSARDVQGWEYQPLGPFLSKNFATTVSPWVVTAEALAPFRTGVHARPDGDPPPLPYLTSSADQRLGAIDLTVDVLIQSARMRSSGVAPVRLSRANARDLYWTPAQLLAHHTSGGCNLRVGDLLASGTISGPTREARGCLLELTWRGAEPVTLPTGEVRRFLEDGDEIVMRGRCACDGATSIGLGECRGELLPAESAPFVSV